MMCLTFYFNNLILFLSKFTKNSKSRLSKPYVRGASDSFNVLESDGCGAIVEYTKSAGYIRSSGWEPYSSYKDRRNRAGEQASTIKRICQIGNLDRRYVFNNKQKYI